MLIGGQWFETDTTREPVNINDEALSILRAARAAVDVVLERRQALNAAGKQDKPLIVLGGESHDKPANKIFHMAVLKGLQQRSEASLAVACERSHNIAPCKEHFRKIVNAPYSASLFHEFTTQSGISEYHADVARSEMQCGETKKIALDIEDQSTFESIQACTKDGDQYEHRPGTTSRQQIKIRNHYMAEKLGTIDAGIIYQQCGNAHIRGDSFYAKPTSESLSHFLKQKDMEVLAMPVLSWGFEKSRLPPNHDLREDEIHTVSPFSILTAQYNPVTNKPVSHHPTHMNCAELEQEYVNAVLSYPGFAELGLDSMISVPAQTIQVQRLEKCTLEM